MRLLLKPCGVQKGPLASLLEPSSSEADAATKGAHATLSLSWQTQQS